MKQITFRVLIAICAFIVGFIFTVVWIANFKQSSSDVQPLEIKVDIPVPQVPETVPDSKIYSVNFCELIQNPENMDEKIVRIKAIYLQRINSSALSDVWVSRFYSPSLRF